MDYQNATSIPSHFGETQQAIFGQHEFGTTYRSPVEHRLTYINNLPVDVVVVWRSGLKFRLPGSPTFQNDKLIARVEITVDPAVRIDMERVLSVVDDASTRELQTMRDALSIEIKENKYGGARIVLDYSLNLEQLKQCGGTLYYHELDCLISLMPFDKVPPHPYSEEGRQQQVVAGNIFNQEIGFGYSVEIVDNASKYGERYLNIGGRVYKVSPKKDYSRRNGIYVLSNKFVDNECSISGMDIQHYPFEGAEETLGLYRTYDEALHCGDIATARKQEIAALEHEIILRKTELTQARQQHEQQMLEKEKTIKQLVMDSERRSQELKEFRERLDFERDQERQRAKDYYEERSHVRKDNSESVKLIPGIIIGIGAVFVALKSFFFTDK